MSGLLPVLLGVLTLAGCGAPDPAPSPTPAAHVSDFAATCEERRYFPDAAAVAGTTPHPVVILEAAGYGNARLSSVDRHDVGSPVRFERRPREPGDPDYQPVDAGTVQLVACTYRADEGPETAITCSFDSGSVTLYAATYRIEVYEARTAGSVGEATLTAREGCPRVALTDRDDPRVYAVPTDVQYRAALRGFVEV